MKRFLMVVLIFAFSCPSAFAIPVTILNSDYHIWGHIYGHLDRRSPENSTWDFAQSVDREYDVSSSSPISYSLDMTEFDIPYTSHHATSTADLFSLGASAADGMGGRSFGSEGVTSVTAFSHSFAEAIWTFETIGNYLTVDLSVVHGYSCDQDVWLYDLTDNTVLFEGASQGSFGLEFSVNLLGQEFMLPTGTSHDYSFDISVDPTHVYAIKMYTETDPGGNGPSSGTMSVDVSSRVPEPATVLLLCIGIAGFAGLTGSRKFSKN